MTLEWELLQSDAGHSVMRTKVPGGWLVWMNAKPDIERRRRDSGPDSVAMTFYPDPNHEWDGNSLP